jgi:hypothetical protein
MGFFSWNTQDTHRSISNKYSEKKTFPVTMLDDKGNTWTEPNYEGYGVFGGKDYYELLAEMNGFTSDLTGEQYTDKAREYGINLAFGHMFGQTENTSGDHTTGIKYPNLVENPNSWNYKPSGPVSCKYQGFFYEEELDEMHEMEE